MEGESVKCELFHDNFQNYKRYGIPKAQLVIADIPYNIGNNAYASSPEWYVDGDNKNGESDKANSNYFNTDVNFNIAEFMHFCSKMLIKEPKEKGKAPCMIVFCAHQQQQTVIDLAKRYGFQKYIPIVFIKKSSPQVLKANMKIVGAIEIYTDKGDVVIDPCAGSGSTLRAALELERKAYGFEIDRFFYKDAKEKMLTSFQASLF